MNTIKPTKKFWIIAVVAVLWNLMGVFAFTGQAFISSAALAKLPPEHVELVHNTPQWLTGIFAIATITGLLGSIFLLLQRKAATTLFLISLLGVIIQMSYSLFATNALQVLGVIRGVIMPVLVIIIAIYLYFFSRYSSKKGYLG